MNIEVTIPKLQILLESPMHYLRTFQNSVTPGPKHGSSSNRNTTPDCSGGLFHIVPYALAPKAVEEIDRLLK